MDAPDIPDECLNDNHDFGQAGRCKRCGIDRVNTAVRDWEQRRSGGAGSRTHAMTNREYREQMKKLQERN